MDSDYTIGPKEQWLPEPQSCGFWNASKVCTKASSRILGEVLAELSNTPGLYSYESYDEYKEHSSPFQKFGLENFDADTDVPEWANDIEEFDVHKDSTSDAAQDERRERVMWKKNRPGHHRRYQTRRQKREPEAEMPGIRHRVPSDLFVGFVC